MKKRFCFGIICIVCSTVLLLASACSSTKVSAGTTPYLYTFADTDFVILGEIFYESKERPGYIELLKAARNLYPDCDYVIDIMIDQRTTTKTNITNYIMTVFQSVETDTTWLMRGTAIRYR